MSQRAKLREILEKLQLAARLLRQKPPSMDIPLKVETLIADAIVRLHHVLGISQWPEPTVSEPDMNTLEIWMIEDGGCEATDGCWIEVDGVCPHGHPSWFLRLGLI